MAVKGGTDYDINMSGNFEQKFDSILSKMDKFTSAVKKLDSLTAAASKNMDKMSKAADKGGKALSDSAKSTVQEFDAMAVRQRQLLGLLAEGSRLTNTQVDSLKAELSVLRQIEKARVMEVISSTENLKVSDATAKAQQAIAAEEQKRLTAILLIKSANDTGLSSVQDILKYTGLSASEAAKYSEELDRQLKAAEKQKAEAQDAFRQVREQQKASAALARKEESDRKRISDALNSELQVEREKLSLQSRLAKSSSEYNDGLKAQLQTDKLIEKSRIQTLQVSDKETAGKRAEANAARTIASLEERRLTVAKLIREAYRNGLTSLGEVKAFTGATTREILTQSQRLSEIVRKEEAAAKAEREREANHRKVVKQLQLQQTALDKTAKAVERAAKQERERIQRVTPISQAQAEIKAKEQIAATTSRIRVEENLVAQARQMGLRTVEEIAQATGLSEANVKRLSGETKKASGSASKLLLSFKQVLLTVARYQIERRIFSFIQESVSEMVDFNAKIESAQVGMASLVASVAQVRNASGQLVGGIEAFNTALRVSDDIVEKLRIKAATTEATFEGLVQAFQTAVGPGLAAGLELDQILETTTDITRAATQLGVPVNQLSEEIRSVLNGTIKLSQTRLAPLITNEEIRNARETGKLYELLSERLSVFRESSAQVAETYAVLKSNVEDSTKAVLASGAEGYFESVKGLLKTVSSLLVKTGKDGLRVVDPNARKIVTSVADGLGFVIDKVKELLEDDDTISSLVAVFESLGTALEVVGSIGQIAFKGILDAARAIAVPINIIASVLGFAVDSAGVLGSNMAAVLSKVVAVVAVMKTFTVLTSTVKSLTAVTGTLVNFILTKKNQQVAVEGKVTAGGAATNTGLSIQNGLLTIGAAKVALMTAGISVLLGLLATFIGDWAVGQGQVVEGIDQMTSKTDELKKSLDDARERISSIPDIIRGGRTQVSELSKALEKAAEGAEKLRVKIQITKQLQGLTGIAKDYQRELAEIYSRNEQIELQGRQALINKKLEIAAAERGNKVDVAAVTARATRLKAVEKALRELEGLDRAGTKEAEKRVALDREKLRLSREITALLIKGNAEATKGAQAQIEATNAALANERKKRQDLEKEFADNPVISSGSAFVNAGPSQELERRSALLDSIKRKEAELSNQAKNNFVALADARDKDLKAIAELNSKKAEAAELEKQLKEASEAAAAEAELKSLQFAQEALQREELTTKETQAARSNLRLAESAARLAEIKGKVGQEELAVIDRRIELLFAEGQVEDSINNKNLETLKSKLSLIKSEETRAALTSVVEQEEARVNARVSEREAQLKQLLATREQLLKTTSPEAKAVSEALRDEEKRLGISKSIADSKNRIARAEIEASSHLLTEDEKRLKLLTQEISEKEVSLQRTIDENANLLDTLKIKEFQAKTEEARKDVQGEIAELQKTEPARIAAAQKELDVLKQKQQELKAIVKETSDARRSIALEKQAIQSAEERAKLEADITRAKLENAALVTTTAVRQAALDQQALDNQRTEIELVTRKLDLQIQEAIIAAATETNVGKRAVLEQKVNGLIAIRGKKLELEDQKLKNAEATVKRSSALASNSLGAGIEDAFRRFNAQSKTSAQIMSDFIVDSMKGVSGVLSEQFTAIFDPRRSAESTEDAFADMFYGIAGQAAAAFTEQIVAQGLQSLLLQTGFFEGAFSGLGGGGAGAGGEGGLATTLTDVFSTIFGEDGPFAALFSSEEGGIFSGLADIFSGGDAAGTAAEAVSDGSSYTDQALDLANLSLSKGFSLLSTGLSGVSGFLGSILGFLPALLSGVLSLLVPLFALLAPILTMAAEAIIQTSLLIITAAATLMDATTPLKEGGLVQAFARGGRVRPVAHASGLRAYQRRNNIPASDTVPAMLTPNEYVMTVAAVKKYGTGFMNAVNSLSLDPAVVAGVAPRITAVTGPDVQEVQAFAEGGLVGTAANSMFGGGAREGDKLVVQPLMVADNATAQKIFSGGSNSFENQMSQSKLVNGDPNATKKWS